MKEGDYQIDINKLVPKTEKLWTSYIVDDKVKYIVTSKVDRDIYYLYEIVDNKLIKKSKNTNPNDFEDIVKLS